MLLKIRRLLLHIQKYHHGGAVLITENDCDNDLKYKAIYDRLKNSVSKYAKETINNYVAETLVEDHINIGKKVIAKDWYLE